MDLTERYWASAAVLKGDGSSAPGRTVVCALSRILNIVLVLVLSNAVLILENCFSQRIEYEQEYE